MTTQGERDGQPEGRLHRLGGAGGRKGSVRLKETLQLEVATSRFHLIQWLV